MSKEFKEYLFILSLLSLVIGFVITIGYLIVNKSNNEFFKDGREINLLNPYNETPKMILSIGSDILYNANKSTYKVILCGEDLYFKTNETGAFCIRK